MQRKTKLALALGVCAVTLAACEQSASTLSTGPAKTLAFAQDPGNPQGNPPDGWVYLPESLGAGYKKFECTFPFPANVSRNPDAACEEKQWGQSGIYREQARNLHATSLPACGGGPGDFNTIRLCNLEWVPGSTTLWGEVGPLHCVRIVVTPTCT